MQSTTARHILMSDEETQAVMNKAEECIESECSIDETADLLRTLKSTERDLEERLESIMNMIAHLQHINEKEERQTDEVREFVKDMLRVFSTEVSVFVCCRMRTAKPRRPCRSLERIASSSQKPNVFPAGFSGDVTKHLDAYNSLPPKPWKPTA